MLMEVAKADVVVVNPTHIAVALRYDRKTMKGAKTGSQRQPVECASNS